MQTRREFAERLAELDLTHLDRAIAFFWFYRHSQEYEERTSSDIADDLLAEGFNRPNVTRLHQGLLRTRFVIRGIRPRTFRLNLRYLTQLDDKYGELLDLTRVEIHDNVLPSEWFAGTRGYLEDLVSQINGSYQFGFYDCCAVMCRRLMESLIIEFYIQQGRHHEVQNQGIFFCLSRLIQYISTDAQIALGRHTPKSMQELKQLGDTAAHDRVYITHKLDIDDAKPQIRMLIQELLSQSGIKV